MAKPDFSSTSARRASISLLKYEEVHLANYETYDDVVQRIPISSRRGITASDCIQTGGTPTEYEMAIQSTTETAGRSLSNLDEMSPDGGAQSNVISIELRRNTVMAAALICRELAGVIPFNVCCPADCGDSLSG